MDKQLISIVGNAASGEPIEPVEKDTKASKVRPCPDWVTKFVNRLEQLKRDGNTKALATLKRSLHSSRMFEAGQYIYFALPDNGDTWRNKCCIAIAGLYAMHPINETQKSFGDCLSPLRRNKSLEQRVIRFLRSNESNLFNSLRGLINLLKSSKDEVNWSDLLWCLSNWNNDKKWAQNSIARDFWRRDLKFELPSNDEKEPEYDENEPENETDNDNED